MLSFQRGRLGLVWFLILILVWFDLVLILFFFAGTAIPGLVFILNNQVDTLNCEMLKSGLVWKKMNRKTKVES